MRQALLQMIGDGLHGSLSDLLDTGAIHLGRTLDTGTGPRLRALADGVAMITLNRPDQRNAWSDERTPALRQTLQAVEADPDARCVVITGAEPAFCAGGDASGMGGNSNAPAGPQATLEESVRKLQHRQATLTPRLRDLAKPAIAALAGALCPHRGAPGGGAGLPAQARAELHRQRTEPHAHTWRHPGVPTRQATWR